MNYYLVSVLFDIYENNEISIIFSCSKKNCVNFFKFSAINIYIVTLSVAQCLPVEMISERAIVPSTAAPVAEIASPPPPEIISYDYTKNETGYMYRYQKRPNFRLNFPLNNDLKLKHVVIDLFIKKKKSKD